LVVSRVDDVLDAEEREGTFGLTLVILRPTDKECKEFSVNAQPPVALGTGASSGIGQEVALRLVEAGF
jgi:hypothetical protein